MGTQRDMAELRRRLFGGSEFDEKETFYATVVSVDEERRTCAVEAEEVRYDDVLLHAVADGERRGFCFEPAAGSTVLVSRIGGSNELYVAMFSEVDRARLSVGEKLEAALDAEGLTLSIGEAKIEATTDRISIDAPEIVLNGGDHGGLVQVEELRQSLDSLKRFVEAMHAALPGAFTAVGAAMSANGAAGKTAYDGAMTGRSIRIEALENTKVKH